MNWFTKYTSMLLVCSAAVADDYVIHSFDRQQLTDVYFSEGASAGDLNGDEIADVVYGPYWFAGPDFEQKREIYEPVPQDRNRYADNFFSWVHDFNNDGWNDVFVVGFPGTPAYVYENPQANGFDKRWKKHQVFDWVSNESPQLVDLVGDDRPELICTRNGFFGFVTIDWDQPLKTWTFHPISEQVTAKKFGHGLGVGDINGDGKTDVIHAKGWYEQPTSKTLDSRWKHHPANLSSGYGGAEMYAYDVDGDGDNDVITSDAAHDFGLSWYEQVVDGETRSFTRHQIMGSHPSENRYGVVFSELHSVALADMDGDGLKDIVTGKTYWSHHKQSPMWDAGAVVYWFQLSRTDEGVDWIPHQIDSESGIGRQLSVVDLNDDGHLDIVVGGMKGAHVLTHNTQTVTRDQWLAAQPKRYSGPPKPSADGASAKRGPKMTLAARTGRAPGAIEGESLSHRVTAGTVQAQDMSNFRADRWSGKSQLWWTGARPGDELTLQLPKFSGSIDLDVVLTCARDYGIVQLTLDDKKLGDPIDLYSKDVVTTGLLRFPDLSVSGDKHTLGVQIVGSNPSAEKSFMCAIDYLRVKASGGGFVAGAPSATPAPERKRPASIEPKSSDGTPLNLGFEDGTLSGWTATGNAFSDQPVKGDTVRGRRPGMQSNHAGDYWIGGFEKHGDAGTGTLTSAPFVVSQPYASFLTNGGNHETTRVELLRQDTGNVFYQINGTNSETMRRVVVDLRGHMGKEIMIRLVDSHRGGWGHLNFDDFVFHSNRIARPTPAMVALEPDEYPHAGLAAQQAAEAMQLPDGFSVSVGASEPDVKQPIAMAIDDRGRVWIAEAYEYPTRAKGDKGRDRILVFEDTDGNGSLDKKTVFFEGLNLVSGLEVGFGGVWVGAAPYLMFIPDANGDDVPDGEPEILLDGWGFQDTHETLNAFIWGPDGWLYGCHGVFTHSRVGKPGTPDEERVPLNCCVWRYHPTRHEFDVFAHGTSNPWGVDFNDHGQAFITACVIPHLYHIIQGARYQRQGGQHFNPHTYRDIVTIADHLHYLGATPHSGNSKSDSAGGGHAHAGAMIYLGGRWPASYRNQLFMNNIHGQRLNMDVLQPSGSGYVGHHGPDFLLTGDNASQILNLRYGPDGNAWMIDWYDMQACHHRKSDLHDRSNGRIYKISYDADDTPTPAVDLPSRSDLELAGMVLMANDWYVRHSRRLLQERADRRAIDVEAIQFVQDVLKTHPEDTRRLRAAWVLHVTGGIDEPLIGSMLQDASPYIRGWAIQLAMESWGNQLNDHQLEYLVRLAATDDSPIVRMYIASAVQKLPLSSRWDVSSALTSHPEDASDHNLPLMYWYAVEPLADVDATRALALAMSAGENIPLLRQFMLRRIGSGAAGSSLAVLVEGLGKADEPSLQLTYLKAIQSALKGQRQADPPANWSDVATPLLASDNQQLRLQTVALDVTFGGERSMQVMRSAVTDTSASTSSRQLALQSLLDANDSQLVPTLISLLEDDAALVNDSIVGLAQYDDPRVAAALLERYDDFSPEQQRLALGTLCSRVGPGKALLAAIEADHLDSTQLTADLVRQLQFLQDKEINQTLERVWGTVRESAEDKLELIAEYKQLINSSSHPDPDVELGRAMFAKTCMKCHVLYGVGVHIGPDLTGSNRSNLDYLLSNIVDPSAVMAKEYLPTIVLTVDGRVVSGLVKAEDDQSLTLQTTDALVVIPKEEIDSRSQAEKSMMPDDQLKQFSPHQVRSLFAYLRGKTQTPTRATAENAGAFFNGRDLTGWSGAEGLWSVEEGELVGRTDGLKRNQWIVNQLSVGDFRLTLDVKLVDNAGNSGIQFRSRAEDGQVSGYQADIGKGWWGKLYEEHGRGLLWDQPGDRHVKLGDWNRYEVVARGSRILTFLNGNVCVDLDDPQGARRGIIAFQLHSGGKTEVRFRNLRLEVLEPSSKKEPKTPTAERE